MRKTVLLIDDSKDIHELVRAALSAEPVAVASAYDGASAIEVLGRAYIDLILLDVDLPGENGFEICTRLQQDPHTASIPVIFLTASAESQDKVRGLDSGGSDYVTKPFDRSEFAARVRSALRGKSKVDTLRSKTVNEFIDRVLSDRLAG